MVNPKHLELARQGKDAWNKWRKENPKEPADFSGTDFTVPENKDISFADFEFGDRARFDRTTFGRLTHFEGAKFGNYLSFTGATFSGRALFNNVTFRGWTLFTDVTFEKKAYFSRARFDQLPSFSGSKGLEYLVLVDTQFRFGKGIFRWTADPIVVAHLRQMRSIAQTTNATDAERDLFILERMAERGVLWKDWWDGGWKSRLLEWWQPAAATVLMFFYWALSNCGRSVALPFLWFIAANVGAFYVYSLLADTPVDEALRNLTFANMLPFGTLAKPLSEHAAIELFHGGVLPPAVGLAAIGQGVVNALLVFLLALALRNHFKVK